MVNVQQLNGSKLISYISSYKADDATGEVLPGSSSLMKATNICFAFGLFKLDERSRKNGEEPVVLRGAKLQPCRVVPSTASIQCMSICSRFFGC